MRRKIIASLACLPLFAGCSTHPDLRSSMAERLCREAFGADEVNWTRLSEEPPRARELLRAAARGPEGRISADVWFQDSQNGVGICELRSKEFDFARVFVVSLAGKQWMLQRVYGTPKIEVPEIVEPEYELPPEPAVIPLGA